MEKISIYTLSGTIYEIDEAVKFIVCLKNIFRQNLIERQGTVSGVK